jgi:hypothetical protein
MKALGVLREECQQALGCTAAAAFERAALELNVYVYAFAGPGVFASVSACAHVVAFQARPALSAPVASAAFLVGVWSGRCRLTGADFFHRAHPRAQ